MTKLPLALVGALTPLLISAAPAPESTLAVSNNDLETQAISALLVDPNLDQTTRRMNYSRAMLAKGRLIEANGALQAMIADNPIETNSFEFMQYAARLAVMSQNYADALQYAAALPRYPESCAIIVIARHKLGYDIQDPSLLVCAMDARDLPQYPLAQRARLAVAAYYLDQGQPAEAIQALAGRRPDDLEALYFSSYAQQQLGKINLATEGYKAVARVKSDAGLKAEVRLVLLALENGKLSATGALEALEKLRFYWRGGQGEELLHEMIVDISTRYNMPSKALPSAAALVRYFPNSAKTPDRLLAVQDLTIRTFGPRTRTPLIQMLDTYWAYRDLLPPGPTGDEVGRSLGQRLATAGLYAQAAQIFEHQALNRAVGPARVLLSNQAAAYHILAGQASKANDLLMRFLGEEAALDIETQQRALLAVAALRSGEIDRARAYVDSFRVPNAAFRAEIYWAAGDYEAFLKYSKDLEYPFESSRARELAVMRAAAMAHTGRRASAEVFDPKIADTLNLLEAPLDSLKGEDLTPGIKAVPNLEEGDRLLALALGCQGRLMADLRCGTLAAPARPVATGQAGMPIVQDVLADGNVKADPAAADILADMAR